MIHRPRGRRRALIETVERRRVTERRAAEEHKEHVDEQALPRGRDESGTQMRHVSRVRRPPCHVSRTSAPRWLARLKQRAWSPSPLTTSHVSRFHIRVARTRLLRPLDWSYRRGASPRARAPARTDARGGPERLNPRVASQRAVRSVCTPRLYLQGHAGGLTA